MIAAKRVPVDDAVQERACESGHKPNPEDQPNKLSVRTWWLPSFGTARRTGFIVSRIREVEELVKTITASV